MSSQPTMQQQTNHRTRLNILALAVMLLIVFFLGVFVGVVSARGVASALSTIGQGLQSAAHWLDESVVESVVKCSPADFHSPVAQAIHQQGDDPDLYSPAERSRLETAKRGGDKHSED